MSDGTIPPPWGAKDTVDIFMKQYTMLKQDLNLQITSFKNHVRNTQIFAAVSASGLVYLLTTTAFSISAQNKHVWLVVAMAITTLVYYLLYDVLDSVFAIKALEAFLSILESRINTVVAQYGEKRIMVWQSNVAEQLWPGWMRNTGGLIHPILCMELYLLILIIGVTVIFPLFVYSNVWCVSSAWLKVAIIVLGVYSVGSLVFALYLWIAVHNHVPPLVKEISADVWSDKASP